MPNSVANLEKVKDVYSHPQAFGQCRRFIDKHLKHAEQHEVASTSEAASIVSNIGSHTSVAISSELAAQYYSLDVLQASIQDQRDNTTRFVTVRKADPIPRVLHTENEGRWKSLLAFSIEHEKPGALANALSVFSKHSLNLTSINNRPSRVRPWHYITLIECQSNGSSAQIHRQIENMLLSLSRVTAGSKFLGRWEA